VYQKVKTGYRDVILAVVDQGVISFLNISDAGFGEAKLWERRPAGKREFKGGLKWKRGRHRVPGQKSG
jgi:tRNA-splicing endonuclease subunit Sen54